MAEEDRRTCYYPDGSIAHDNVPCTSADDTACCGDVDVCLDNGLCLIAGHQPYQLSRGACTNRNWDHGCPGDCASIHKTGGCAIINLTWNGDNNTATYCCGTPVVGGDGDSVVCPEGDDFEVKDGNMIFGRAALFDMATSTSVATATSASSPADSTSTSTASPADNCGSESSSNNDVAIGAGVGIPLGIIALLSIGWALWERKRAKSQVLHSGPVPWASETAKPYYTHPPRPPVELDERGPIHQLDDTGTPRSK